ncbi:hypothetical protein D3C84_876990 [compost metagenome]
MGPGVQCSLVLFIAVLPVFFRAEPRTVLATHDQAFRIVRLEAVIDSLGLYGEKRGRYVVPFNAGTVAVMAKAFYEFSPGCWIELGTGRQAGKRFGRFVFCGHGEASAVYLALCPLSGEGEHDKCVND